METVKMENKSDFDIEIIQQIMACEFANKLINAKNLGKEFLNLLEVVDKERTEL